ncbi:MAG: sugar phosphate isomerase/epimerase [candidate division WS1 bacterium]|nr:sugar phosphate isomerase/epimerase [candidate division WS1 bacterium]
MTTKIGFRSIGYRRYSPEEAIRRIAAVGFDGVEVCLEHPGLEPERIDVIDAARLAQVAASERIEIATVSYHGDRDPLPLRWERALRAIELTQAMGTGVLIINSPRPGPDAPPELEAIFHEQLGRQIERAERLGVTLALEPEPGLLIHGSDDMLALLERTRSDVLAVNLDVGHAYLTESDFPGSIVRLSEHIAGVHVEGMPAGEHRHLVPGEGDLDLPAVLDVLAEIGFEGWLTVDLFDIADAPDEAATASLEEMRRLVAR